MKLLIALLTFVFLVPACRTPTSTSSDAANLEGSNKQKVFPILILAGGFNSCVADGIIDSTAASATADLYDVLFEQGIPKIINDHFGTAPAILTACYTGATRLIDSYATAINQRYGWNARDLKPGNIGVREVEIGQGKILDSMSFMASMKQLLHEEIKSRIADGYQVKIFGIGHSYGGATIMNLSAEFKDYFEGIITIDPISLISCQAGDMLTDLANTATANHPGCKKAPDDSVALGNINTIQNLLQADPAQKKFWINMYQTDFVWLHSGPINTAKTMWPRNYQISPLGFVGSMVKNAHARLAKSEPVWKQIRGSFATYVATPSIPQK